MIAVLLVERHREVSWFLPLLLVIYPVTETLFSLYRKSILRGTGAMKPDGVHFHMLVHKRLNRWSKSSYRHGAWRNSLTSIFFWVMTLATVLPALVFWDQPLVLLGLAIGFVVAYVWFYFRLVRFRVPQWMVLVDGRRSSQAELELVKALPKPKSNGHERLARENSVGSSAN